MRKLLVVSSTSLNGRIALELRHSNWELDQARSGAQARELLARRDFLVGLSVFWDQDDETHREALAAVIYDHPDLRWIAALPRDAVQREPYAALIATRLYDYFSLPLEPERLTVIVGHAYGMTEAGSRFLREQQDAAAGRYGMLGCSPAMRELFGNIEWATKSDAPVLIMGETGTGKETTARAIHASSPRADRPFVPVSCGTASSALIEQLLFGTSATALPGARSKSAPPESANGGTVFLDGVTEMPLAAQAQLLRFLTERERSKAGERRSQALDVRIIAATAGDLEQPVATGEVLSDLFYRLAVIVMRTPPLRERVEDLEMLAQHFVREAAHKTQSKTIGVSRAALAAIKRYHWPGNLLELGSYIFRAVLFSQALHLSPRDLDLPRRASEPEPMSLEQSRERAEKETLRQALARNRRNVTRAAQELQVSRMTIYRLLEKHGMDRRS
jgi:DNA-binding NtrC family response regulator